MYGAFRLNISSTAMRDIDDDAAAADDPYDRAAAETVELFCSRLCCPADVKPLDLREWRRLSHAAEKERISVSAFCHIDRESLLSVFESDPLFVSRLLRLRGRADDLQRERTRYRSAGISLVTAVDPIFPARMVRKLERRCPPVLYSAGDSALLTSRAVAFVGSREADGSDALFAEKTVRTVLSGGYAVVSGGARGCDTFAERAALRAGGCVIEFLADSIEGRLRKRRIRTAVEAGRLLLLSAVGPDAGFRSWAALARNRYIYADAEAAVVIKADLNKGGTWSGAVDAIRSDLCPVLCRDIGSRPGNQGLIRNGAIAIDENGDADIIQILKSLPDTAKSQLSLFE